MALVVWQRCTYRPRPRSAATVTLGGNATTVYRVSYQPFC